MGVISGECGEGQPNTAQSSNEESSNEKSRNEENPRIGIEGLRRKLLRNELGNLLHGLTASWADNFIRQTTSWADSFSGFNSHCPLRAHSGTY